METLPDNPEMFQKLLGIHLCEENKKLATILNTFSQCVKNKKNVKKCDEELNNLIVELHKHKLVKEVYT